MCDLEGLNGVSSQTPSRKAELRSYLPANSLGEMKRVTDFFLATFVCLDPHPRLVDVGLQAPGPWPRWLGLVLVETWLAPVSGLLE